MIWPKLCALVDAGTAVASPPATGPAASVTPASAKAVPMVTGAKNHSAGAELVAARWARGPPRARGYKSYRAVGRPLVSSVTT
jgi:hypothetical protein